MKGFMFVAALLAFGLLCGTAKGAGASDFLVDTRLSYGYGGVDERSIQRIVEITPAFRFEFSPHIRAVLSARVRLDFADRLEPARVDPESYSSLSRPAVISDLGSVELRDVYIERVLDSGVLRLGKQQIVWGKLDGIKVLDVLNPQNFREFILDDFGESRISLWSGYLDISFGGWRAEVALIPDSSGHAIAAPGAWFEFTAPRYRYGAESSGPSPSTAMRRESLSADASAYALRLSRRVGAFEFGAMAYSGKDHEPLGRIADVGGQAIIERYYERRDLYGLHAETAIGAIAVRAEVALQPNRIFNTRTPGTLATTAQDQITAGVGIDIDGPWKTFINIQYLYDEVRDAPLSLVRPREDRIVTVFLRRSFNYETLQLSARWYRTEDLGDDLYSLALEYAITDSTELKLAADRFSGATSGIFGQFSDRDRITLSLSHTF